MARINLQQYPGICLEELRKSEQNEVRVADIEANTEKPFLSVRMRDVAPGERILVPRSYAVCPAGERRH
jgi:hypothetical protein